MSLPLARPIVLLVALSSGCRPPDPGGTSGSGSVVLPPPVLLRDFAALAPLARCHSISGPGAVRSLTPAGQGRMLALSGSGARVELLGSGLRVLASRDLDLTARDPSTGIPTPARDPSEAWLLGDSLLAVVDGPGRALLLHPGGMNREGGPVRVELPFPPLRAVPLGTGLALVSPGPVGGRLVHLWQPGSGLRSLDIRTPPVDDGRLVVISSALVAAVLPRGEAVFLHPVLVPRGYRVDRDGGVVSFPIPVPEGESARVGWVPRFPWTEGELLELLPTALDAAADAGGGILLLTRSGEPGDGFREKAVIRLDSDFRPVEALRLPVNGIRVVGDPDGGIIVEDHVGGWHRCAGFGALGAQEIVSSNHGLSGSSG
jgi:hypothetical protein